VNNDKLPDQRTNSIMSIRQTILTKRKTYTSEFKARVVLEYIDGRKSLIELANLYDVHPNQIKNWKSYFMKQAISVFEDRRKKK
jgi:transposase-like protein